MAKYRPEAEKAQRLNIGKIIKDSRQKQKMEQADLAKLIGVSTSAVGNWELGLTRPDISVLPALCGAIKVSVAELLGITPDIFSDSREVELLETYRMLNETDQKRAFNFLIDLKVKAEEKRFKQYRDEYEQFDYVHLPISSGPNGMPAPDSGYTDTVYIRSNQYSEYSNCIVQVQGKSMEPKYKNKSYIYVFRYDEEDDVDARLGDDVIMIYEGTYYFKKYGADGYYSYNPNKRYYPVIRIYNPEDFRFWGRVVGPVDDEDIASGELERDIARAFSS